MITAETLQGVEIKGVQDGSIIQKVCGLQVGGMFCWQRYQGGGQTTQ